MVVRGVLLPNPMLLPELCPVEIAAPCPLRTGTARDLTPRPLLLGPGIVKVAESPSADGCALQQRHAQTAGDLLAPIGSPNNRNRRWCLL